MKIDRFSSKDNGKLKIDKSLPKILVPSNKVNMFVDWYNDDLRFLDEIPRVFEHGYLEIDLSESNLYNLNGEATRVFIKAIASARKKTYREIENLLKQFTEEYRGITAEFTFIENNKIGIGVYSTNIGSHLSNMVFTVGANGANDRIEMPEDGFQGDWDEACEQVSMFVICIFAAVMWYLATATNTTKYYREETVVKYGKKNKTTKQVKPVKTIQCPVYDLNNIRKVKTEKLIKRREGWTYSHSFQVHGHYRHYKSGKVIFINSYVKGKDKAFMPQEIIVNPDKIKVN